MHEITDDEKGYLMTLENIYKYASDEELRAIVSSICLRIRDCNLTLDRVEGYELTDKEINEVAKGLRKPQ
jgi:hypothetical protein